ncbi:MAG: hypothetical protein LBV74_16240 [Tannerella sp.]|jgi:hypothetical protein|nr:hypothetical protein [Tannerella sp.]
MIIDIFDKSEIEDLTRILFFFNEQICPAKEVADGVNIQECYHDFFAHMLEKEKTGNFDIGISFQKQKEMYDQISESTFNQIWFFGESLRFNSPDAFSEKYIFFTNNGKYWKFLEEFGKENANIKKYFDTLYLTGDMSPTVVSNILYAFEWCDTEDVRIQLLIAIHYLTLNDQFERREKY